MMNLGVDPAGAGVSRGRPRADAQARHRADRRRGQDRHLHRPRRRDRESSDVEPDMVTLAKALGGGLPSGAIGGTEEVDVRSSTDGTVYQVGTYNGNPLVMAAARANLLEVMTPDAYAHLDALNDRILDGLRRRDRRVQPAGLHRRHRLQGLRHVLARRRSSTTRPSRRTRTASLRPRLALQHEPRRLHDARPRGGVDAVRPPHLRGLRPVRRVFDEMARDLTA